MTRTLTTLAATLGALAVSTAPASAGLLSSPLGLTTKPAVLYNGHAALVTNGTADDQMMKAPAKPRPRDIVVTKDTDISSPH
jgi:hypothetical protein